MKIRVGGDIGDSLYLLSVIRQIPDGPHDILFVDQEGRCTRDFTKRTHLLIPLFEKQPYISSARNSKDTADIDFTEFRNYCRFTSTLPQAQAVHLSSSYGINVDDNGDTPWLTVETEQEKSGIVISQTNRYSNPAMPWTKIVHHYGWQRLTFVGLPDEHARFCAAHAPVRHHKVKDFYELAQIIGESKLYIGNQSSPMALAVGIGHPFIQSVCPELPDCVFNRANAQYICEGSCVLPDIDGSGTLEIEAPQPDISHFSTSIVPPGYWQYPELPASTHFDTQKSLVAQIERCDAVKAAEKLLRYNVSRVPKFFSERGSAPYEIFKAAYAKAFNLKPA